MLVLHHDKERLVKLRDGARQSPEGAELRLRGSAIPTLRSATEESRYASAECSSSRPGRSRWHKIWAFIGRALRSSKAWSWTSVSANGEPLGKKRSACGRSPRIAATEDVECHSDVPDSRLGNRGQRSFGAFPFCGGARPQPAACGCKAVGSANGASPVGAVVPCSSRDRNQWFAHWLWWRY